MDFRGKKITLMGLGLLGRGVGDARFFAEHGADLIVTDLKSAVELKPSLEKLRRYDAISYTLGQHRLPDFRHRDLIIKAPNAPLDSPFLAEARQNKIPIWGSTALFAKLARERGAKLIGITGTRGKSTVTQLIYEILQIAHLPVHLAGNVRGVSSLALLPKIKKGDLVVLELDSWQLAAWGEHQLSPDIAVFTNFLDDHLNYYGGDRERYFKDKANIFKWQRPGDKLILGGEVKPLPKSWKLKLLGEHNRANAACAVAVARILKIKPALVKKVVTNFSGLPGRLELVRESGGVKFYNDTTATTPDALLVALRALHAPQKVILIAGGADKNLPVDNLLAALPHLCRKIILLPGTGTNELLAKSEERLALKIQKAESLAEAWQLALKLARPGDFILLSPGFASFGLFTNEFDRGDQFNALVAKLA